MHENELVFSVSRMISILEYLPKMQFGKIRENPEMKKT
jgi:hypothetical protein